MGTVSIQSRLDHRNINDDSKIVYANRLYVKAEVEEQLHYWPGIDSFFCVLKVPEPVYAAINREYAGVSAALSMAQEFSPQREDDSTEQPGEPGETTPGSDPNTTDQESNSTGSLTRNPQRYSQLLQAQQMVDAHALNRMGNAPAAVFPSVAAIPMKSNIRPYGPYASANFLSSTGGVNVEVNPDIAPWVYGSLIGMNTVGQGLANANSVGLERVETGSFTKPGYPMFNSMAEGLSAGGGAILSDINFSYGSSGITTTYKFQTYTPKKGTLYNQSIEKLKNIVTARTEQLRFLRNEAINRNKVGFKSSPIGQMFRASNLMGGPRNRNSLNRVLVGGMAEWHKLGDGSYSYRTLVGTSELAKTVAETSSSYRNKAFSSLDFFFAPVSKSGAGNLPAYSLFEIPEEASSSGISTSGNSIGAHPPVSKIYDPEEPKIQDIYLDQYNLSINREYLDPLTFPEMAHHHKDDKLKTGNPYDIVGRGDYLPKKGLLASKYSMDDPLKYSSDLTNRGEVAAPGEPDYRFMAFRGPMVLQQWGYDTDGKPIPNESDVEFDTRQGKFVRESLKDKFMENWVSKPQTWPVGPVDLRFDRNRGVWTAPPPYRIIAAELMEDLEAGKSAVAKIIQDKKDDKQISQQLYDKEGEPIQNPTIKIKDRIDCALSKGTKVYCYYDTYFAEYIAFTSIDSFPTIITGEATATFHPEDEEAGVKLVVGAKFGDISITPEFSGYSSSSTSGPEFEGTITAYNVKRCGAVAGDLVTIHRVSMQGNQKETKEAFGSEKSYVYIVAHTGENYANAKTP